MTLPRLHTPRRDGAFVRFTSWRGSSHSDDREIIFRNMTRSYMDPKGFAKGFLGFRLARDEEREG